MAMETGAFILVTIIIIAIIALLLIVAIALAGLLIFYFVKRSKR